MAVSAFFILNHELLKNTKKNLKEQAYLIESQLKSQNELPNIYPIIEVKKDSQILNIKPTFNTVWIKIEENKNDIEEEEYIEYSKQIKINNEFYSIKLRQSSFETEDLVVILTVGISIALLTIFIIAFFASKRINKTVWINFEKNLQIIEKFSFNQQTPLMFKETDIEEFDRLNLVVKKLTNKLNEDYLSLKEFSENASHEIQTPLSIVLLNLEEILQQELNEETFRKVLASINALKRLSSLNQSLILLTKIENKQFIADKIIHFNELVSRKTEEFSSLFESKHIKVELESVNDFAVKMNEQLAEILINNLFSNAIKHNVIDGEIRIYITENYFEICNSGEENSLTNDKIFNRFTKGHSKSYGLGLAIVKNICETNNLKINYSHHAMHCFKIRKAVNKL